MICKLVIYFTGGGNASEIQVYLYLDKIRLSINSEIISSTKCSGDKKTIATYYKNL